ncbi:MAG: SCO family protein [Deltaproteobacteria bacterium]|nr:SCO family protein [Deltaproteobacteria bacterium]
MFDAIRVFFDSWRFPSFMLCVVGMYLVFEVALIFIPPSDGALGAFAEDFRIWCFGYDPATGRMEAGYLVMFLTQPLILGAVIYAFWRQPLREVLRRPLALAPYASAAFVLVLACGAGFAAFKSAPADTELPFPAEELRTAFAAPGFSLTDQNGKGVDLASLRGRVVLVTAVYATCGYTCPMIMGQTKKSVAELTDAQRSDLSVLAITLDPENDTPGVLAEMAKGQEIAAPLYRLVTGEPNTVNELLDRFSIARTRNPETGAIDHANLFILIDRSGYIAYRLSLGERQQRWLVSALKVLLAEPVAPMG